MTEKFKPIPKRFAVPLAMVGSVLMTTLAACTSSPSARPEGCVDESQGKQTQTDVFIKRGIWGEIPLIDLRTVQGFAFSGSGGFLSFSAAVISGTRVQFAWRTMEPENPSTVISELPVSSVLFKVLDNPDGPPKVSFGLDPEKFLTQKYTGSVRACVLPADYQNPNSYLLTHPGITTFTMSRAEFGTFRVPGG